MTSADWLSTICIIGLFVVIGIVAVDRNRLRHRLDNSEGRVTGLSLDVDSLQERVAQLTSYLNRPESWDVGATPPAALAEKGPVGRWTPAAPPPREAGRGIGGKQPAKGATDLSEQPSRRSDYAR